MKFVSAVLAGLLLFAAAGALATPNVPVLRNLPNVPTMPNMPNLPIFGQSGSAPPSEQAAAIQHRLEQRYAPAKTTADGTAIDVAGAVLVLRKDKLLMNKLEIARPTPNVYKDGAIRPEGLLGALGRLSSFSLSGSSATPTRAFATGDKFWVTNIAAQDDGLVFTVMSDPIQDISYHGALRFPYDKTALPTPDQMLALVSEVFQTDAPDAAAPPPPPPEPKTIALGQPKDLVVQNFGQPTRIAKVGNKELYFYPDMKVTFVDDKVVDVQ